MDIYDSLRFSLLLSFTGYFLNYTAGLVEALKAHNLINEIESAQKEARFTLIGTFSFSFVTLFISQIRW